jgi:hypothetical protein
MSQITITTGLRLNNPPLLITSTNKARTFTQTTARGGGPGSVDVATGETTIDFGDIVPGFIELVNLDEDNFVDYGVVTGQLGFRLRANGGVGLIELGPSEALIMQANTAACRVQITALNL